MPSSDRERSAERKRRGAYYTGPGAAAALCAWAVRSADDRVLDPSFGEGAFVVAAARRLASLGGPASHVHGAETDAPAHARGVTAGGAMGVPPENLARRDFFALDGAARFDAVVGNPPYIRFQRFKGALRARAVERARAAGVELSPLASSWAPFVVHATALVRPGGRLAMLVPHEIGQAGYSRPVLDFLADAFGRVTIVAFRERLFPELDQDAVAVLGDDRGGHGRDVRFARTGRPAQLAEAAEAAGSVDVPALVAGARTLRFWDLPEDARQRYLELERHPAVVRLGDVAAVTSGYVTGANDFFHLSPAEAARRRLAPNDVAHAAFRARALAGVAFTRADWRAAAAVGAAGYLFAPRPPPGDAARAYIASGEAAGAHAGYKTRSRAAWYRVPRVHAPDLLLAAMAADAHALVRNAAGAAPANTLHAVSIAPRAPGAEGAASCDDLARAVAVAWRTSASWLARELEGRVLGGGMLKLEPGEAGRVLLPAIRAVDAQAVARTAAAVDDHLRAGRPEPARRAADRLMLGEGLGMSEADAALLADAARMLRELRRRRSGRPPRPGG